MSLASLVRIQLTATCIWFRSRLLSVVTPDSLPVIRVFIISSVTCFRDVISGTILRRYLVQPSMHS